MFIYCHSIKSYFFGLTINKLIIIKNLTDKVHWQKKKQLTQKKIKEKLVF
jgi:hypothetical protein